MNPQMRKLKLLLVLVVMSVSFISCGDNDSPYGADYTETIQIMVVADWDDIGAGVIYLNPIDW